ncbi:MAG: PduL/EutD family phosphate acyltransferase [Bacilli bacterium]
MQVSVGISNHHVHLSENDLKLLFDKELEIRNELKQPGQFASNQLVDIIGPKGEIKGLRVLGPARSYTQVEVSKTDCYKLGINPPVRDSGDLEGAAILKIVGPKGVIKRECGIIATRHIHVNEEIRKEKDLIGLKEVSVRIGGEKGGILNHVHLKDSKEAYFEIHLDTDDANAFMLKNDDLIEIIKN